MVYSFPECRNPWIFAQSLSLVIGHLCMRRLQLNLHEVCTVLVSNAYAVTHCVFLQEKMNKSDEKSLSVLAACLGDMESCRNVDALRKGLRWEIRSFNSIKH